MVRSVWRIILILWIVIGLVSFVSLAIARDRGRIPNFPQDQVLVYEVEFAEQYPAIVAQWGSQKTVISTRDFGCHSVSSNGRWLVVDNEGSSTITVYDLQSGEPASVLSVPDEMLVCEIDFDETGNVVAFRNPFSRRPSYALTLPDGEIVDPPEVPSNPLPADLLTINNAPFRTLNSPDGRRVLYAKCLLPFDLDRHGCGPFWGYVIYDREADEYHLPPHLNRWGNQARRQSRLSGPEWSYDSNKLVYPLEQLENYTTVNLATYTVDQQAYERFMPISVPMVSWPLWSPNDQRVLVMFQQWSSAEIDPTRPIQVGIYDLEIGDWTRVNHTISNYIPASVTWFPDSNGAAIATLEHDSQPASVVHIDLETGQVSTETFRNTEMQIIHVAAHSTE